MKTSHIIVVAAVAFAGSAAWLLSRGKSNAQVALKAAPHKKLRHLNQAFTKKKDH